MAVPAGILRSLVRFRLEGDGGIFFPLCEESVLTLLFLQLLPAGVRTAPEAAYSLKGPCSKPAETAYPLPGIHGTRGSVLAWHVLNNKAGTHILLSFFLSDVLLYRCPLSSFPSCLLSHYRCYKCAKNALLAENGYVCLEATDCLHCRGRKAAFSFQRTWDECPPRERVLFTSKCKEGPLSVEIRKAGRLSVGRQTDQAQPESNLRACSMNHRTE